MKDFGHTGLGGGSCCFSFHFLSSHLISSHVIFLAAHGVDGVGMVVEGAVEGGGACCLGWGLLFKEGLTSRLHSG